MTIPACKTCGSQHRNYPIPCGRCGRFCDDPWHSERAQLAAALRANAASIEVGPYDDFALGHVHGLEEAADLLDGKR